MDVAFIGSFILIFFVCMAVILMGLGLSLNPLRWRGEARKNRALARLQRISELEHDLGYLPCSSDTCWPCEADAIRNRYLSVDSMVKQCYDKMVDSTYVKLWRE